MVRKKKTDKKKLLTETELELMGILWKLEEGTVNDLMAHLSEDRKLAYTSVSTILRILEQKQVVGSRKEGKGHVYFPILEKDQYERTSLNHLVDKVFDGTPSALVRRLLDNTKLSHDELESIWQLLKEKKR